MSAIAPIRMEAPQTREPAAQPALSALKTSAWFTGFGQQALVGMAAASSLRSFAAGQVVLQEGKNASAVLLIVKGRIRSVRRTEGGREVTLETHRAGEVLTEALFDAAAVSPNDWVASETSLLLFIPRDEFLAHVKAVPEVALGLCRDLERRLARSKALACDLALADVQTRLYRALARLAREEGEPAAEGTVIRKCPTQQEIGNEIGACRETVSRMIAELARQALVSLKGRRLTISPEFLARTTVAGVA
jgi:CRP-like cAMP-binding protein